MGNRVFARKRRQQRAIWVRQCFELLSILFYLLSLIGVYRYQLSQSKKMSSWFLSVLACAYCHSEHIAKTVYSPSLPSSLSLISRLLINLRSCLILFDIFNLRDGWIWEGGCYRATLTDLMMPRSILACSVCIMGAVARHSWVCECVDNIRHCSSVLTENIQHNLFCMALWLLYATNLGRHFSRLGSSGAGRSIGAHRLHPEAWTVITKIQNDKLTEPL